jgi:hypothetical protein
MNPKITHQMLIDAIEPHLNAEDIALKQNLPSWDLPEFSEARRLTAELGMQWDFLGWSDALHCIITHGQLGGIATKSYLAKLDNGEGGTTVIRAANANEALAAAMA